MSNNLAEPTIYIVTTGDITINAVFTDWELALLFKSKFGCDHIWTYDANPLAKELRAGFSMFAMHMHRDGTIKWIRSDSGYEEDCRIIEPTRHTAVHLLLFRRMAKDEQHAIEMANQKRIEMIESDEWPPEAMP